MAYTIVDLKYGLVILKNTNNKLTKKILKKVFNADIKSYESPGDIYYFADKKNPDGFSAFTSPDLTDSSTWNLCADGIRRLPSYLSGYKTMFEYHRIEHLPIQDVKKFKI